MSIPRKVAEGGDALSPIAIDTKRSRVEGLRHRVQLRPANPDRREDEVFFEEHINDPNYDITVLPPAYDSSPDSLPGDGEEEKPPGVLGGKYEYVDVTAPEADIASESPYPEVRAAVLNTDDPTLPANTFRMWFIGLLGCLLMSGFNQIFAMRYPGMFMYGIIIQLLSLPLGKAMARVLPTRRFTTFGYTWSFNPGPFNIKEHVCLTIMAQISTSGAYSNEVTLVQRRFYGLTPPLGHQFLLSIGPEVMGFAMGSMLHGFIVAPPSMIWPGVLVNCALFNALHRTDEDKGNGHLSRRAFFCIAMGCSFVWYWVPGYLIQALSLFNWVCWIFPNNVPVNVAFGAFSGLGGSLLTFDWSMISLISNPLVTPWWAQFNTGLGFVLIFWILAPFLYFTNVWNTAYFPMVAPMTFDNTGSYFNITRVITDGALDPAKYQEYSPLFLPLNLALAYGCALALLPAIFVHSFLWYRKDVVRAFRRAREDPSTLDVHGRLMLAYLEVPFWWYASIGAISFVFLCIVLAIGDTGLPIWGAVVAVIIAGALAVPFGILQAVSNFQFPAQLIPQLIAGYMFPNKAVANTVFKTINFTVCHQGISFASNLKLGHYMKVPPRVMFSTQVVATTVAAIWAPSVQAWMISTIPDICTPRQKQGFICPGSTAFATASIIWGGVGPARLFNIGAPYSSLLWFFLVGFIAPIPFYFLARRYPLGPWRYFNAPICIGSVILLGPASALNFTSTVLVGYIFNRLLRRRNIFWWTRYNYALSVALDGGVALAMLMVFFTLQVVKPGGVVFDWRGNTIMFDNADGMGIPWKEFPESGVIGPTSWT